MNGYFNKLVLAARVNDKAPGHWYIEIILDELRIKDQLVTMVFECPLFVLGILVIKRRGCAVV